MHYDVEMVGAFSFQGQCSQDGGVAERKVGLWIRPPWGQR